LEGGEGRKGTGTTKERGNESETWVAGYRTKRRFSRGTGYGKREPQQLQEREGN